MDYYVDGDLFALCIDRNKPVDTLALVSTAPDLYNQYIDAIGGKDAENHIKLLAEITQLQSKIQRTESICHLLQIEYNESLVKDLKDIGIRRRVTKGDLVSDLKAVITESKRFVLELEKRQAILDKRQISSDKPTKKKFYDVLIQYDAKAQPDSIDVFTYCRIYNSLVEKQKAWQKKGLTV